MVSPVGVRWGMDGAAAAAAMAARPAGGPRTWKSAIDSLKTALLSASNPFMVRSLIDCFRVTNCVVVSKVDGIKPVLEQCRVPEEITEALKEYDGAIRAIPGEGNLGDFQRELSDVGAALSVAIAEIEQHVHASIDALTPYIAFLYKDPTFQRLPSRALLEIEAMFAKKAEKEKIEGKIIQLCTGINEAWEFALVGEIPDDWNKDLDEDTPELYDLVCAIAESYSSLSDDSIVAMWDQPAARFKGKKLYLSCPEKDINFVGYIETAERSYGELLLQGERETQVRLSYNERKDEYNVQLTQYETAALGTKFREIQHGASVTIHTPPNSQIERGMYTLMTTPLDESWRQKFWRWVGASKGKSQATEIALIREGRTYQFTLIEREIKGQMRRSAVLLGDDRITMDSFDKVRIAEPIRKMATISKALAAHAVQFKTETDEQTIKLEALDKIEALKQLLLDHLAEKHPQLLNRLVGVYIREGLRFSQLPLNSTYEDEEYLINQLEQIRRVYHDPLEIQRSLEHLLAEVVLDANQQQMVAGGKNLEVVNTMQLLQGAVKSIEPASNLPGVFFMGNTGSGKSTSVGYLLGEKLELVENSVRDHVYRYKDGRKGARLPKIGQRIGESETLYAGGFPAHSYGAIVDCPGFQDTRGEAHQLCTNISIDQAVKRVESIRSVVVVIPAASFTVDRANPVIELVHVVRDKFPFAFTTSKETQALQGRVFMLVTKSSQIKEGILSSLKDYSRFNEFLSEVNATIQRLNAEVGGSKLSPLLRRSLEERKEIWSAIVSMSRSDQIAFADLRNRGERTKLKQRYFGLESTEIPKALYQSSMAEGSNLHRKFGGYVEVASKTWSEHILGKFADFPCRIEGKKQEAQNLHVAVEINKGRLVQIEAEVEQLSKWKGECNELLTRCNEGGESVSLPEDLQAKVEMLIEQQFADIRASVEREKVNLERAKSEREGIDEKIKARQGEIDSFEEQIRETTQIADELGDGVYEDSLFSDKYSADHVFRLRTWKEGRRSACIAENRPPTEDDYVDDKVRVVAAKDYDGTLYSIASISREYRLTPEDQEIARQFKDSIKDGAFKGAEYAAELKGRHFTVDLGMALEPAGRKVTYAFQTHWKKQRDFPEVEIVHRIPKREYNWAEISNHQMGIKKLKEDLKLVEVRVVEDKVALCIAEEVVSRHELALKELTVQLERKEQESKSKVLEQSIKDTEQRLGRLQKDIGTQEAVIRQYESSFEVCKGECASLEQEQLRFALIIHTDWGACQVIRQFVGTFLDEKDGGSAGEATAIGGQRESGKTKESTLVACRKFREIFDKEGEHLHKRAVRLLASAREAAHDSGALA